MTSLALWLADYHLLAVALLLGVTIASALLRQPAQRLALANATLASLAALALLSALPGWSLVHLMSGPAPAAPISQPLASTPSVDFLTTPRFEMPGGAPSTPAIRPLAPPPTAPRVPATPEAPTNWVAVALAVYASGSGAVVIWLIVGGVLARRVRDQATSAPPELQELLRQVCGNEKTPPELLLSPRLVAPAALGLRRPAIILPAAPPAAFPVPHSPFSISPPQLLPILAHECAHLQHRDLHTLAATRVLLVLLWPQPLFWLLRRTIRLDQETLADAAAADRAGRLDYAQQLLAWARTANTQRPPRLAGAVGLWEGPSQLKRRIALLLNEQFAVMRSCSAAWRRLCIASLAVAAVALSLVTLQPSPVAGDDATAASALSGDNTAEASSPPNTPDAGPPVVEGSTTINGSVAIEKGSPTTAVFAPGAPIPDDVVIDWTDRYEEAGPAEPNVYAGLCVDEHGEPLAGADVSLFIYENFDYANLPTKNVEPAAVTTTDAAGRFRFENVAALAKDRAVDAVSKQVAVIAHAPGRAIGGSLESINLITTRGKTSRLPLVPAATFSGRVTDVSGHPIAGAVVATGWGHLIPNSGLLTRTDAQGRYRLNSMHPATPVVPASLIVTHPDYVAKFAKHSSNSSDFDVQLRRGSILTGRVVYKSPDRNVERVPVAGVRVWAVGELKENPGDEADGKRIAVTDADGRYELRGLVGGKYYLNASAPDRVTPGLADIQLLPQSLAVQPLSIEVPDLILTDGAIVRVKLIDAATGKPLAVSAGTNAFITPTRKTDLPLPYAQRFPCPVDEQAETELRLPPGQYDFFTLIPATAEDHAWTTVYTKAIASGDDAGSLKLAEGDVVEVTMAMEPYFPSKFYNPGSAPSPSLDLQIPSLSPRYYPAQPASVGAQPGPTSWSAVPTTPPTTNPDPLAAVAAAPPAAAPNPPKATKNPADATAARIEPLVKQLARVPNVFMGYCIDETGSPLAGVDVSLFVYESSANENVEPVARTKSAADGRFEFNQPIDVAKEFPNGVPEEHMAEPPIKVIAAVAQAPGRTTEFHNDALHTFAMRGQAAILIMTPAQKLTGRVTDDTGQPVANAIVTATKQSGYVPGDNLRARTDAEGRYVIDDLPSFDAAKQAREHAAARERNEIRGMYPAPAVTLSVQHPAMAAHRVNVKTIPGELDVALMPGSTVKGRVVARAPQASDAPRPLGNIPVWIMRTLQPYLDPNAGYAPVEMQQAKTDAEGNYSFTSLPASEYAVTATAPNLTTVGAKGIVVGAGQTTAAPDVVLSPGAILRMKLVNDATKEPLKLKAGQKAYVLPQRISSGSIEAPRMESQLVVFNAEAVGETRVAPGRYNLFVSIPGQGFAPNLESHANGGTSTVEGFEVREGETLEIDVPLTAFEIQPESGAAVMAAPADAAADAETVYPPAAALPFTPVVPIMSPADGEQPGVVPLKAEPTEKRDLQPARGTNDDAPPNPNGTPLRTPTKAEAFTITGRCVDETGKPVTNARLWLPLRPEFLDRTATLETVSDDGGKFVFEIPAELRAPSAKFQLSRIYAYHPSLSIGIASAHKQLSSGDQSLVDVNLSNAAETTYQILDPAGDPVADARVEPWHLPAGDIYPEALRRLLEVRSDRQGRVTLRAIGQPEIRSVRVQHAVWGEQEFNRLNAPRLATGTELRLQPVGSINGRIQTQAAGPIAGIPVYASTESKLRHDGGPTGYANTTTDAEGHFEFPAIAAGIGRVNFYLDDDQPWRVRSGGGFTVQSDEQTQVNFPLEKVVRVSGMVLTADTQQPVPNAQVHVHHGDLSKNSVTEQVMTDPQGRFEALVLPGEMRMYVQSKPKNFDEWVCMEQRRKTPIRVPSGDEFELPPIELERTTAVTGEIVDGEGKPLPNVNLYGVSESYTYGSTSADEMGRFTMRLPPSVAIEEYVARAGASRERYALEVVSEQPLKLRAKLKKVGDHQ